MKVNKTLVWLWFLYLLLIAGNIPGLLLPHSHESFWVSVGVIMWIILVGIYASLRAWPLISFPKPEAERINGATYTQPILAWRMWKMNGDSLESLHFGLSPWSRKARWCAACCYKCPKALLPQKHCTCGIYSRKDIDFAFWRSSRGSPSLADPAGILGILPTVLGLVYLWGNIVEGTDGYRAQYAYPAKLFVVDNLYESEITAIAKAYGIPYQKFTWWQNRKFKTGGTQWISAQSEKLLQLNQLSSLFPESRNESSLSRSA